MYPWNHLLLASAASLASTTPAGWDDAAPGIAPSTNLRLEYFALVISEVPPTSARADAHGVVVGFVEWRRRTVGDGIQLECESTFLDTSKSVPLSRVLHVERLTEAGPRLVWREIGAGAGRALRAEWTKDGSELNTVEWSPDESTRDTAATGAGAVMPLYLLELARAGRITAGSFLRYDPLVRGLESIELCTSYVVDGIAGPAVRTVELARADGSSAGRYVFQGSALVAFQWQDGDVWAVSQSADEYAGHLAELDPTRAPRDP